MWFAAKRYAVLPSPLATISSCKLVLLLSADWLMKPVSFAAGCQLVAVAYQLCCLVDEAKQQLISVAVVLPKSLLQFVAVRRKRLLLAVLRRWSTVLPFGS